MTDLWRLERCGGTAVLRYANPPSNLFGLDTLAELDHALDPIEADPEARVVILTGLPEVFGAGLDLRQLPREKRLLGSWLRAGESLNARIAGFPKPVIAAIEGPCYGGALELALACHLRVGSATARFAQPEILVGIIPAGGGTQRLPRLIGRGRALHALLTGTTMKAAEAERIGLLNSVVGAGDALHQAQRIATRIGRQDPRLTKTILEVVGRGVEGTLEHGIRLEQAAVLEIAADAAPSASRRGTAVDSEAIAMGSGS